MANNYAFIRSVPTFGSNPSDMPNWDALLQAGWDVPLIAYDDPRLPVVAQELRRRGINYGIWADPHGRDPIEYAQLMAGLSQRYNPYVLVPDLEFIAKGNQGSPGWNYNQQLAREWARLMPNQRTAITVMPNQEDFNYEAWRGIASEWLPQAYGADPTREVFDPEQITQTLIRRGVDPSLITPVLGPGHRPGYSGRYSLWTVDDFIGRDIPRAGVAQMRTVASTEAPTTAPARKPKLSQSAEMIAQSGLRWGGNVFTDAAQFQRYLARRGGDFNTWARNHPTAAAALMARKRPSPKRAE